ncbi:unnamed protein product (macronuclear) [Paramecium tetraurelia]|uniref:Meiosis-specific nuclear structural protein 1 n=1 Tax=Paramecium tetraurelia TaxID=5888 RepID=A0C7E7_PARTE|nr:uncharacterized protein GSPATT00035844001 [Paramecium tetraurelia]CAK66714.1 unnamed protein product [Paramecium tetraurelia]|eukprot:XP_001434111.1 hypothetical protein (macronuclear) [Paramecium tetraurelia strain d4-2]
MIHNSNRNPITDPYSLEDQLARELQKRKVEEEKRRREIERICAESEEIKLLKQKVQTAYVTKERTQQLAEQQLRRIQELKQESEIEAAILEKLKREQEEERSKEKFRLQQRLEGKYTLQKQMKEHEQLRDEAREQYIYEKEQVNRVIHQLINEDRKFLEDQAKKKKIAFSDMQNALREKAELIFRMKQREREENQKYLDFIKEKDRQAHEIKVKKQEENAAKYKDKIFQKLKEEEERRRQEAELLTELRFQLYQEQYDAQQRQKDIDEANKREFQKREMQQAEQEARLKKQRQKEEEQQMERDFRDQMMRKFAEDDKLEQLGQQKRRMKEIEHKREVERLWQQKLEMYQMEKQKELEQLERQRREEAYKQLVVEEEKNRILQEHLQQVGEFIPKGLLLKQGDSQFIKQGQSNASYQSGFRI